MSTMDHVAAQPRAGWNKRRVLKWVGGIIGGLLLIVAGLFALMIYRMNYVPADLDTSTTRLSAQGVYQSSYSASVEPVPINTMHTWTLHLETADGRPLEGATITVDGDMPQHGHGLPTRPLVTQDLGNGDYLVEGVKFHMPGWWYMQFDVTSDQGSDTVRFDFILK